MKDQRSILKSVFVFCLVGIIYSCEQNPVNPSLKLDEVLIPQGYVQDENPSMDNQSKLEELRLENPDDQFYYLKYVNGPASSFKEIMFPQKELVIKSIDSDGMNREDKKYHGVIVKKIEGDPADEVFTILDHQPRPIEGIKTFYEYISENMKYPEQAKEMGIEGKVFVEFVVDKNGNLTKVKAIKGIGAGCDEEAVRVLKDAPNWTPGNTGGMDVGVRMILPITYRLSHPQENSGNTTKIEEVNFN